jgi:uncharacterized protein YndB with AHSA1/START domain
LAADGRVRSASPDDPDAIHRQVRIAARPETVFAFLTDPAKNIRWGGTHAEGDPRPGGTYEMAINPGHIVSGEYMEVVPNRKVVYAWGWADSPQIPPGSTVVEVLLAPDGDGTMLHLTHRGLPAAARGGHGEVWDHYLPRLAVAASGGDPGPDPWAAGGTES